MGTDKRELKAFLATYKQFPAADAMQDSALMECAEARAALDAENERLRAELEATLTFARPAYTLVKFLAGVYRLESAPGLLELATPAIRAGHNATSHPAD